MPVEVLVQTNLDAAVGQLGREIGVAEDGCEFAVAEEGQYLATKSADVNFRGMTASPVHFGEHLRPDTPSTFPVYLVVREIDCSPCQCPLLQYPATLAQR